MIYKYASKVAGMIISVGLWIGILAIGRPRLPYGHRAPTSVNIFRLFLHLVVGASFRFEDSCAAVCSASNSILGFTRRYAGG